ncbi:DHH family phosphoesterase [Fundidesulfovibrio soli]|uniref:DHH family phosphoesterase n=1 Tax=Fundidesulfovibrio soli TaxID=2922716 RepID=UPI001FB039D5|nr:bifunctional oligoribonuclease/PAP phosphatase NrnA [Fundidesulfovibrio soli]
MHDVLRALQSGTRFLVASHAAPDGDAIGSMAAMGHLLLALGKQVALYDVSGLPRAFTWVKLPGEIATELPPLEDFDFIVALDCGDSRRGGPALQQAMTQRPTIVIDHHVNNPQWGAHNWVEVTRSSTCEMVAELALALGLTLTGALGEAVYLGIVTDTGHFSFDNTSPHCMEMVAQIMRQGLKPALINELIQNQWSLPRFRLWGEVLGVARLYFDGQLGVIRITREQLERLGADAEDCDGLANFLLRVKGCRVVQSLREDEAGGLKLSLRSVSELNIQPVAAAFGGGGHRCAAGASIKGALDEVEPRLIEALGQVLGA